MFRFDPSISASRVSFQRLPSQPIYAFAPSLPAVITTRNVQHHRTRWRRVDDDQDGGVRLDTFETVRTESPRSLSPCLTSSCSSHSPRRPSSRLSSSTALNHQDMVMSSLSGNDNPRKIDWIRQALVEGRYYVRAWERLQVDWPSQDNNLECNHAAPWTGPDGKAVGVVTPISYHDLEASDGFNTRIEEEG